MHPFEVLADPVRRRILEVLGPGEVSAGGIGTVISTEFGITQPAVSQHLKVLREAGLVTVRAAAAHRFYAVDRAALAETGGWFDQFRDPFAQPLDALATELARGRRSRRRAVPAPERSARSDPRAAGA